MRSLQGPQKRIEEGYQGHSGHEVCHWAYAHTLRLGLILATSTSEKVTPGSKFLI